MEKIISRKYTFESEEDINILMSVKELIGKLSESTIKDKGLSEKEAKLCHKFYEMMCE